MENASHTATSKGVPSAGLTTASPAEGEKNTNPATKDVDTTNLHNELVNLLSIDIVTHDLQLAEWREVVQAYPNRKEKGWKTIYRLIKTIMEYLDQTEKKLKIDFNKPIKEQDPLNEINDLANKKRIRTGSLVSALQVLRRLGSIFTSVYAADQKLKKAYKIETFVSLLEGLQCGKKDCFMSKGIKQSPWEKGAFKVEEDDVAVSSSINTGFDSHVVSVSSSINTGCDSFASHDDNASSSNSLKTPKAVIHHEFIDTPGGSVYWVPRVSASVLPVLGTVYDSLDECIEVYRKYASEAGFGIRLSCQKRLKCGYVKQKYIVCNREGCPKEVWLNTLDPKKNDRQVRSSNFRVCGCKARVVFDMVNQSSYSRNNQQCKRTDHRTCDHAEYISTMNMIISLEREINPKNPQHAFKDVKLVVAQLIPQLINMILNWSKECDIRKPICDFLGMTLRAQQKVMAQSTVMISSVQESLYLCKASDNLNCFGIKDLLIKTSKQSTNWQNKILLLVFPHLSTQRTNHVHHVKRESIIGPASKQNRHLLSRNVFIFFTWIYLGPVTPRSINHEKYTLVIVDEYSSTKYNSNPKSTLTHSISGYSSSSRQMVSGQAALSWENIIGDDQSLECSQDPWPKTFEHLQLMNVSL
ncbi:hypothetical protein Tco_0189531 [Tanacetum coccineum]